MDLRTPTGNGRRPRRTKTTRESDLWHGFGSPPGMELPHRPVPDKDESDASSSEHELQPQDQTPEGSGAVDQLLNTEFLPALADLASPAPVSIVSNDSSFSAGGSSASASTAEVAGSPEGPNPVANLRSTPLDASHPAFAENLASQRTSPLRDTPATGAIRPPPLDNRISTRQSFLHQQHLFGQSRTPSSRSGTTSTAASSPSTTFVVSPTASDLSSSAQRNSLSRLNLHGSSFLSPPPSIRSLRHSVGSFRTPAATTGGLDPVRMGTPRSSSVSMGSGFFQRGGGGRNGDVVNFTPDGVTDFSPSRRKKRENNASDNTSSYSNASDECDSSVKDRLADQVESLNILLLSTDKRLGKLGYTSPEKGQFEDDNMRQEERQLDAVQRNLQAELSAVDHSIFQETPSHKPEESSDQSSASISSMTFSSPTSVDRRIAAAATAAVLGDVRDNDSSEDEYQDEEGKPYSRIDENNDIENSVNVRKNDEYFSPERKRGNCSSANNQGDSPVKSPSKRSLTLAFSLAAESASNVTKTVSSEMAETQLISNTSPRSGKACSLEGLPSPQRVGLSSSTSSTAQVATHAKPLSKLRSSTSLADASPFPAPSAVGLVNDTNLKGQNSTHHSLQVSSLPSTPGRPMEETVSIPHDQFSTKDDYQVDENETKFCDQGPSFDSAVSSPATPPQMASSGSTKNIVMSSLLARFGFQPKNKHSNESSSDGRHRERGPTAEKSWEKLSDSSDISKDGSPSSTASSHISNVAILSPTSPATDAATFSPAAQSPSDSGGNSVFSDHILSPSSASSTRSESLSQDVTSQTGQFAPMKAISPTIVLTHSPPIKEAQSPNKREQTDAQRPQTDPGPTSRRWPLDQEDSDEGSKHGALDFLNHTFDSFSSIWQHSQTSSSSQPDKSSNEGHRPVSPHQQETNNWPVSILKAPEPPRTDPESLLARKQAQKLRDFLETTSQPSVATHFNDEKEAFKQFLLPANFHRSDNRSLPSISGPTRIPFDHPQSSHDIPNSLAQVANTNRSSDPELLLRAIGAAGSPSVHSVPHILHIDEDPDSEDYGCEPSETIESIAAKRLFYTSALVNASKNIVSSSTNSEKTRDKESFESGNPFGKVKGTRECGLLGAILYFFLLALGIALGLRLVHSSRDLPELESTLEPTWLFSASPSISFMPSLRPTFTVSPTITTSPSISPSKQPKLEPTPMNASFQSIFWIVVQDGLRENIPQEVYIRDLQTSMDRLTMKIFERLPDDLKDAGRRLVTAVLPSSIEDILEIPCPKEGPKDRCEQVSTLITLEGAEDTEDTFKIVLDVSIAIGQLQIELDEVNPDSPVKVVDTVDDPATRPPSSPIPTVAPFILTESPSLVPTTMADDPTPRPTDLESMQPTEFDLLDFLVENSFDEGQALANFNSPQYQAYGWLSGNAFLQLYSERRLLQRYAMATLYYSTNGDGWILNDLWLSDEDECRWYSRSSRPVCTRRNELVNLELDYNNLNGILPPELGLLSGSLERIVLRGGPNTGTGGTLPTELGYLTKLKLFFLRDNLFSGTIPTQLGRMTELQQFDLAGSNLVGSIPTQIGNFGELSILDLSENRLNGTLPTEIGNLGKCQKLILNNNFLSGPLPSEIGFLRRLQAFMGGANSFSSLSTELGQLNFIDTLLLYENQLVGTIPTELSRLRRLNQLDFSYNRLTGSIPAQLGDLFDMRGRINLSYNRLTGQLPSSLGNLTKMRILELQHNNLSGSLPSELSGLERVTTIRIDSNDLTGEIPPAVCASFNQTLPGFHGDCSEFQDKCPCCTTCCTDGQGCACRYLDSSRDFLCFQQKLNNQAL